VREEELEIATKVYSRSAMSLSGKKRRTHSSRSSVGVVYRIIRVSVMQTMAQNPPSDRSLKTKAAHPGEDDPKRESGFVGVVRPEAMVSEGDSEKGDIEEAKGERKRKWKEQEDGRMKGGRRRDR
jgi:hypothetical protein